MRVLVTNDDGIEAPWLHALAATFEGEGSHVTVIAPAADCSGMSGALAPLLVAGEVDVGLRRARTVPVDAAWAAESCSPSVCVLIGLAGFLDHPVDLVVSGVNHGWNVGRDIWRSGTVWAAITAWGLGVPALAVSAAPARYSGRDREEVTGRTARIAKELVDAPQPEVWNVNFPEPPATGWREATWVTMAPEERLSATSLTVVPGSDEGDVLVRMRQEPGLQIDGGPGSDAAVVRGGAITVSRLDPIDAVTTTR